MKDAKVTIKETRGQHVIKVPFNLLFRVKTCLKCHFALTNHLLSKRKNEWDGKMSLLATVETN